MKKNEKNLTLQTIKSISFNTNQWDSSIDFIENLAANADNKRFTVPRLANHIYPVCRQMIPGDTCPSVLFLFIKKLHSSYWMLHECEEVTRHEWKTCNLILKGKPRALLCAAFEPTAHSVDNSILAMESH